MGTIGNIIWLIFGGLIMAIMYFISGLLLIFTIIGIPFGLQVMKIGILALWPFNSKVVPTRQNGGCLLTIFNVIWILLGGIWISVAHVLWGIFFCITIIGIPFGRQHFKLAGLALTPFGFTIV